MSTEIRNRVREVFAAVCERPEEERKRALEELCGGNEKVRGEVESLLGFHAPDDKFLSASAMRDAGFGDGNESQIALTPGTKIGRYSVTRLIGSGGMGVVYEGRQENPDRKVAIKLMRPGGASSAMVKRFTQEGRALGLLQHPGIAQIYDAGRELTPAGPIPYLVMELVEGITLLTFIQRHSLALQARLKLVLQVCDAVAHAHQRGVIHRDLKPTNVLVDETGRARILDFGIARLTENDARATISTSGGQVLGTLAYMSPEQAGGDPAKIDTRADVYSLGVVMYEALTGKLPIDVTRVSISEAVRMIQEIDPAPPSVHNGECRGELDTIVLKALSKDASRRYQSADALGEDIRRYLTGRPILARGDSALYVLSKHVRRHRVPMAAAAILLVGLVVFSIYASIKSAQARIARDKAEYALALAKQQEKRADDAAQQLERELHYRNVENARLIARGGNLIAAENLLVMEDAAWPGSPATRWGLRDLYRGFQCLRTVPGPLDASSLSMHANSKWTAFTGAGRLRVVDIDDGAEVYSTSIGEGKSLWMDFSRDGKFLVLLGEKGHLTTYRVDETGALKLAWEKASVLPDAMAFDIDAAAASVVVIGASGTVHLLNLRDGQVLFETAVQLEAEARGRATLFSVDAHSAFLATSTTVYQVDLSVQNKVRRIAGQSASIGCISVSPDGKYVITGGNDQNVRFYNIASGETAERFSPANGTIRAIEFSPDGKYMATLGWWRIDLWDAKSHQRIGSLADRPVGGSRMMFTPDSSRMISDSGAGVRVWSVQKLPLLRELHPHEKWVGKMSLSTDGKRLATCDARGHSIIWDAAAMTKLADCGATGTGWEVAASSDGSKFASMSETGLLEVFDGKDYSTRLSLDTKTRIADIKFVDHDRLLAMTTFRFELQLRDPTTGTVVKALPLPRAEYYNMEGSEDGNFLFILQRNSIQVYDAAKGTLAGFPVPESQARGIASNKDGSMVALGLFNGRVELWNTATQKRIQTFTGHRETVQRLALTPEGNVLASAAGGALFLWDTATGDLLMALKESVDSDTPARVIGYMQFIGTSKLVVGYSEGSMEVFDFDAMDQLVRSNVRSAADVASALRADSNATDQAYIRKWLQKVGRAIGPDAEKAATPQQPRENASTKSR